MCPLLKLHGLTMSFLGNEQCVQYQDHVEKFFLCIGRDCHVVCKWHSGPTSHRV